MQIAAILRFEVWAFLGLLGATIAYRLLTRKINLGGLLSSKDDRSGASPERVQMLLATLTVSGKYLSEVLQSHGGSLPDIAPQWLYTMGGSGAIYALAKTLRTFAHGQINWEE
jgi:hypothetical protein